MSFSKIAEADVFDTYRTAYSSKIVWEEIFEDDIIVWLSIFEKGKNCSLNLTIPALLAMTASLCGPNTRIKGQANGFVTSTNLYLLAVCDPGGGKSVTFENVIEPVMRNIYEKTGKNISTESYTTAGLQKHQIAAEGVGLITSDEGHRFLAAVNAKQSKGESERAYLCKMWSGKGDYVDLSSGSRGFKKTSMSMCLYVQPHPLMCEMPNFTGGDGFLDRFLLIVSRPLLFQTNIVKENYQKLLESETLDFVDTYYKLFLDHQDGIEYFLSEEAQKEYDDMVDSYAESLDEKYKMKEYDDEDKENDENTQNIPLTQTDLCMSTSKDTLHVIRLAAALQITSCYLRASLKSQPVQIEKSISVEFLRRGRKLYSYLARQKSIFAQAVQSVKQIESVKVKKVTSFKVRVIRAICLSDGPVVTIRHLQRKLNNSLKDSIIHELQELEKENFGMLHRVGKPRKDVYLKSAPSVIPHEVLTKCNVAVELYNAKFKSTASVDKQVILASLPSHPQHDEIVDWFQDII